MKSEKIRSHSSKQQNNDLNLKKIVKTYPWLKASSKVLYQNLRLKLTEKVASKLLLQIITKQYLEFHQKPTTQHSFQQKCNNNFRHIIFNIKRQDLHEKIQKFDQQQESSKDLLESFESIIDTATPSQIEIKKQLEQKEKDRLHGFYNPPKSALKCPHCLEYKIQSKPSTQTRMGNMKTGGIAYICLHYKCEKFMKIINAF